ncbi:MAG: sugar phosphate isomerase/epimerase [Armatimonadetes bacterium]|nr:sugar phosphate isomerase/epimerase [Armatimonadota bacterium]
MEIGCYSGAVVGKTLRDKLEAVKAIGYDFLELTVSQEDADALNDEIIDEIARTSESAGFPIKSLSLGAFVEFAAACKEEKTRAAKYETARRAIALASRCGAEVILCASWEPEGGPDALARYRTYLPPLADIAAEKGLRLAIEHIGGSRFLNSPAGVGRIARAVNHPAVGVYFDIGNAMHAGEDPVAAVTRLGSLIFQVHLKGIGDRPLERMPLDAVLEELQAIGYAGRGVTEVIDSRATDNGYLADALATLKAHGL